MAARGTADVSEPILIALDSGTSWVKALAFNPAGKVVTTASRPNAFSSGPGGAVEQDMVQTWDDTCAVLNDVVARLDGANIVALAVTGQGDGTWLIDERDNPVAPAILWLDARAGQLVEELRKTEAARSAFAFTGTGLAACQQPAQLLWLDRNRPEVLKHAATGFHWKDWLYLKLTGVRATDPAEACFSYGDYRTRRYCKEVLDSLGLAHLRRLLPTMLDGTREWHGLSAAAAARTGLVKGLPVVLGYLDLACGALGAGAYGAGIEAGVSILGTTGMHLRLVPEVDHVVPSAEMTGYCMPFPVPGYTLQMQTNMAASLNLDWLASLVQDAARLSEADANIETGEILHILDRLVMEVRPGALLYHPFISSSGERGPFINPYARAGILGIDQSVRLPQLARAVYDGLGLAARDCYIAMGGLPAGVRVTGGAAHSKSILVILAACLNCPVSAATYEETGATGAAMMAAVSIGLYRDMAECAARWIAGIEGETEHPDPNLTAVYELLFPIYREGYEALPTVWRQLHAARQKIHGV
jgi:erythritol kinase (D-erythritol 1-phosphate-forming)